MNVIRYDEIDLGHDMQGPGLLETPSLYFRLSF